MTLIRIGAMLSWVLVGIALPLSLAFGQGHTDTNPQANELPVPLPERNPLRGAPPAVEIEAPPHPRERDASEWSAQDMQAAQDQCSMMLDATGIVYRAIDPIREGACGTPAPVEVSSVGKSPAVAIDPPAHMTCAMAASLGAWSDTVLQVSARKHLNSRITAIRNVASYVCRNRYNSPTARVSEHARANALDMAAFRTQEGEWITVLDNWGQKLPPANTEPLAESTQQAEAPSSQTVPSNEPEPDESPEESLTPRAVFLLDLHTGGCMLFGTVLGPEANEAHKDHFHFDLAARRHSNYCE